MTVQLNPHWQAFVRAKISSGQYDSEQHLLEAALRELEQSEKWTGPEREELLRLVDRGEQDIVAGRVTDGPEAIRGVKDNLKRRHPELG